MEPRLLIAYALIALMIAGFVALIVSVKIRAKRQRAARRGQRNWIP